MNRVSAVKKLLNQANVDALLITNVPTITYLTGYSNFSIEEREAFLLLTKKRQYILTDGRYATAIKNEVPDFSLLEISSKHPFLQSLRECIANEKIEILGIEETDLHVNEYKMIKQVIKQVIHVPVATIRIRKSPDEIAEITKACALGDKTFQYIQNVIKPGISEISLAWELEKYIKDHGADISFKPIVAFGSNAAIPHHNTGNKKLKHRSLILLDFGVKINNYCSDMTRTVFLGKATEEEKRIYQTVYDAQQKAIEVTEKHLATDQSVSAVTVDTAARSYILQQGYPTIPHSLGHGIGLEVHEQPSLSPVSKHILTDGMVFSIEPGIYIPQVAGVRIEDLFVIEKGMLRKLTKAPNNFIEL